MDEMHPEAQALVARLGLAPHPEGGYYRETWRSAARVMTARGERAGLTVIHLHVIDSAGTHEVHRVGRAGTGVAVPHVVVPAGSWQAARPVGGLHVLASCTVAPGFEFADFEMARESDLARLRPDLAGIFHELCRPSG